MEKFFRDTLIGQLAMFALFAILLSGWIAYRLARYVVRTVMTAVCLISIWVVALPIVGPILLVEAINARLHGRRLQIFPP